MEDYDKLRAVLEARGYRVQHFDTARQAADYLDREIDGTTVAFGGSVTLKEMDLYPRLSAHNRVLWHWEGGDRVEAASTEVYVSSVNALAETGELVNIDGVGNRVASTLFGHEKVYFVAGKNKVSEDFHSALWRLRNVVAPKNAQRLHRKTPCAVKGDKCYNCSSPERICNALVVHYKKMRFADMEVVLVDQDLGY